MFNDGGRDSNVIEVTSRSTVGYSLELQSKQASRSSPTQNDAMAESKRADAHRKANMDTFEAYGKGRSWESAFRNLNQCDSCSCNLFV